MSEPKKVQRTVFHRFTHPCHCGGKVTIQNWEDTPTGRQRVHFTWFWCDTCMLTGRCRYLRDEVNQETTEPTKEETNAHPTA